MVRVAEVPEDGGATVPRHSLDAPDVYAGLSQILDSTSPERVSPPCRGPGGRFEREAQLGSCVYDGLDHAAFGDDPEVRCREEREVPRERPPPEGG